MKVGTENVLRFERSAYRSEGQACPNCVVYAAQRALEGDKGHDGRGLLFAIGLSMGCWGMLGFFLLR